MPDAGEGRPGNGLCACCMCVVLAGHACQALLALFGSTGMCRRSLCCLHGPFPHPGISYAGWCTLSLPQLLLRQPAAPHVEHLQHGPRSSKHRAQPVSATAAPMQCMCQVVLPLAPGVESNWQPVKEELEEAMATVRDVLDDNLDNLQVSLETHQIHLVHGPVGALVYDGSVPVHTARTQCVEEWCGLTCRAAA